MQHLIAFAHSPRFEEVFKCQVSIICVAPQPKRTVVLPKKATEWKGIIQKIVPLHESVGGSWLDIEVRSLVQEFGKRTKLNAPIHCECALVEYYAEGVRSTKHCYNIPKHRDSRKARTRSQDEENRKLEKGNQAWKVVGRKETSSLRVSGKISQQWKSVPAFSYLGVSKLSCSPCQAWIEAYNKRDWSKFYTRGSHGKWYWPWAIPRFEENQLTCSMRDRISTAYYEHCRAKERVRRDSDRSNSGMPRGKTSMYRRHDALAADYVSKMRNK